LLLSLVVLKLIFNYKVFSTKLYVHEIFGSLEFRTIFVQRREVVADPLSRLLTLKLLAFRQCFLIWLHWMVETCFSEGCT